ncbi:VOC family protein [Maledivibacter halophilus]|uniref:Methylmalonyl-CoA epimerase n=1 Tax=Maledivibacter halophilus TaxID=36842 RepID=A0A1T5LKB8_9FIRM|nr:VOC family protein [Maledivibacter halophilus]SKC76433.1 methylmalonyl-CoA epimerase [Maledivibacter halophilus]
MKIDHVGIVMEDGQQLRDMFKKYFNGKVGKKIFDRSGFISQIIELELGSIEILCPVNEHSPITRFLDKKGEGLHHISIRVENIKEIVERMKDDNYKFIDNIRLYNKGNEVIKYIFLNPKYTNKILIELQEKVE